MNLSQGARAAWVLFACVMGLYFLILMALRGQPDVINVMLLLPVGGLVLALVVGFGLPREAWGDFWAHGALCMLAAALLWGVTCSWALGF